MSGASFKQGYACAECVKECGFRHYKRTALYRRNKNGFTFSGYVECPQHGIQKGLALRDL